VNWGGKREGRKKGGLPTGKLETRGKKKQWKKREGGRVCGVSEHTHKTEKEKHVLDAPVM